MDQRGPAESWAGAGADLGRITIGDYALLQITALYGPLKLTTIATDNQCMLQSVCLYVCSFYAACVLVQPFHHPIGNKNL